MCSDDEYFVAAAVCAWRHVPNAQDSRFIRILYYSTLPIMAVEEKVWDGRLMEASEACITRV